MTKLKRQTARIVAMNIHLRQLTFEFDDEGAMRGVMKAASESKNFRLGFTQDIFQDDEVARET